MSSHRPPTDAVCTKNKAFKYERRSGWAIWFPFNGKLMRAFVAPAQVCPEGTNPFDIWVWARPDGGRPTFHHYCSADAFVDFGTRVRTLVATKSK